LHPATGKFSASRVILKPALPGSGIIASNAVRAVCQAVGIRDILSKALGSRNSTNLAMAAIKALKSIRSLQTVSELRNKPGDYFLRKRYEKDKSDIKKKSD
jgi:small subunit ribosomal protein S5